MKKESSMQKLFAHAGNYKYLTIASWILSAVSALIALLPFYDIWRIMQEVVLAAPDYSKAQNLSGLGWSAVGFALLSMIIYICALLCSHIAAFHVQANMRSTLMRHILTLPMGFMDSAGSGKNLIECQALTALSLSQRRRADPGSSEPRRSSGWG